MAAVLLVIGLALAAASLPVPQALRDQLHNVEIFHVSQMARRNTFEGTHVTLHFFNRTFDLVLAPNREFFKHRIEAVEIGEDGVERPFRVDEENYFQGEVEGVHDSYATLYISPTGFIHGRIAVPPDVFILEQAYRHIRDSPERVEEYTVVYREEDVKNKYDPHSSLNESGHSFCGVQSVSTGSHDELSHEDHDHILAAAAHNRHRRGTVSNINNFCLLTLVSDSQFFSSNGGTSAAVTSVMLSHIGSYSNPTFSGTTWVATSGGATLYQNLQVSTQKIIVYPSTVTDPYYRINGYPGSTGAQTLLSLFSTAPSQTSGWTTCLAHLFTHYNFDGGTLGLAWVGNPAANRAGGICHASASTWLNTGWTTDVISGVAVPTVLDGLVTAHELGHNWGSPHDTSGTECLGVDSRYLMYPTAVDGSGGNNRAFSPCSIRNIPLVLAAKGTCFQPSPSGFCGDYVTSAAISEQCDAGVDGDVCCIGINSATPCRFIGAANCSDSSDVCCKNCRPSNNSVTCFTSFSNDPQCRAGSQCNPSTPKLCPSSPAKAYGEPCGNGGICSGAAASASACIPFCKRFGAATCTCPFPDECHLCCIHNASVTASCGTPFAAYGSVCTRGSVALANATNTSCIQQPYWTTRLGTPINYNATQKDPSCNTSSASCWLLLDYTPNTPCSLGYCDVTGTCTQQSANNAYSWAGLGDISFDKVQKWMKQNIVGTLLLFSFVIWLPLGCLVHRHDLKERKQNASYGLRQAGSTMTFRPKSQVQLARVPGARQR